jgi:hypothetical protein
VVNMLRQVGLAVGVAILVAVIGTPHTPSAQLSAFQEGWWVISATSLLAALAGVVFLRPARAAAARRTDATASDGREPAVAGD